MTQSCFCTYFDQRYLARGLALYHSLERYCESFHLWVLCLDKQCFDVLRRLDFPQITLIPLATLEESDPALVAIKTTRTLLEYYFTCTPLLPLYVLNHFAEVDFVTYVDADLYFFHSLASIFDEIGAGSIAMIEHRFSPALAHMQVNGLYNVGWLSFRRDINGLACLQWWRQRCLDWCYDRVEEGRFADQKYLEEWPDRFEGVVVLRNIGVGLAPWNLSNYSIRIEDDCCYVENQPLVMFHFHGLSQVSTKLFDTRLPEYRVWLTAITRDRIYLPYVRTLVRLSQEISVLTAIRFVPRGIRFPTSTSIFVTWAGIAKTKMKLLRDLILGQCILVLD